MKYLKIYEEYAEDRVITRRREAFDKLSNATKKNRYDAKMILNKLKAQYPKENFTIIDYYDNSIKCVFLSDLSSLLNVWNMDSDRYEDGLNKDFAKWLKSKNLNWSWHSPKGQTYWDGIAIMSKDYLELYWYYNNKPLEIKKRKVREDKSSLEKAISAFNSLGYDVYDPGVRENDNDSSDRDIVELDEGGMKNRFYIIRENPFFNRTSVIDQAKSCHNKYIQTLIRYYKPVKAVYDYCETIADGPLWTMSGGGMQLQQFYGDDNGYLCVLYLGMEDDENNTQIGSLSPQNVSESKFKNLKISEIKKLKTEYKNLPDDVKRRVDDHLMKKDADKYNL